MLPIFLELLFFSLIWGGAEEEDFWIVNLLGSILKDLNLKQIIHSRVTALDHALLHSSLQTGGDYCGLQGSLMAGVRAGSA